MNMSTKKISDLKDEIWYRLLKVIYISIFICTEILVLAGIITSISTFMGGESGMLNIIILLVVAELILVPFLFYLIKHSFYYIVTGKWRSN